MKCHVPRSTKNKAVVSDIIRDDNKKNSWVQKIEHRIHFAFRFNNFFANKII